MTGIRECHVDESGGMAELAAAEALLTAAYGPGSWATNDATVDWKEAASVFPLTVPVDESVVALLRLPIGVTPMYEIVGAIDKHLGPGLVFRTDTGIQGWAVIARPEPTDHADGSGA